MVEEYQLGIVAHPSDIEEISGGFEKFLNLSKEQMEGFAEHSSYLLDTVFDRNKIIEIINTLFWRN